MAVAATPDRLVEILRDTIVGTVRRDGPDLSARQFGVFLICYIEEGPHTVRGLAARLEVSKPAITRSLDRLAELGLAKRGPDVWLWTNVMDKERLPHALAGPMVRWRWQNDGCFRSYKHTLKKVKLVSRTVRLLHREAEGSWLALRLLPAQGVMAQTARRSKRPTTASECEQEVKCSPRKILIAIGDEITSAPRRRRPKYEERLRQAQAERRQHTSTKASRAWPRRTPHKPPELRKLSNAQKSELARRKRNAA